MKLRMIALLVAFSISALFAAEKIVTPNKDGVGVYKNEIRELYEKPLFTVGTSDRLSILSSKGNFHKVRVNGQVGWIEKSNVQATGKSRTFVFDNAEVVGYLDNPTPVYIMDTDDPNADPINLDRSFKDALRENVDKETVERQVK
ncbi:MAG: hypothetical protein GX639_06975 [Fibrobacter sp.]|nr:hypothetical protein [Fibrobacter sp.]